LVECAVAAEEDRARPREAQEKKSDPPEKAPDAAPFRIEDEGVTVLALPGDGDSLAFYGSGVLPDGAPVEMKRTPIINYTYAKMRPILERLHKAGEIDKRHGVRVRYANPINGGPVLPTMGAGLAMLPAGFKGEKYRSTDGTIFVCAEGKGTTTVDGKVLEWGPWDVFVVPPWKRYSHQAQMQSVLFSISDRPSQEALGIWREETSKH